MIWELILSREFYQITLKISMNKSLFFTLCGIGYTNQINLKYFIKITFRTTNTIHSIKLFILERTKKKIQFDKVLY